MRNLAILTVGFALAMLGPVSPAVAFATTDTTTSVGGQFPFEACGDAGNTNLDIASLTAISVGGVTDTITVTMVLCSPLNQPVTDAFAKKKPQYRVRFDYEVPLASDQSTADPVTCVLTSEAGMKVVFRRKKGGNVVELHGKGTITFPNPSEIRFVIPYAKLKLSSDGNLTTDGDAEIWASTHTKGTTEDQSPDTNPPCIKFPQIDDEVLQITLD